MLPDAPTLKEQKECICRLVDALARRHADRMNARKTVRHTLGVPVYLWRGTGGDDAGRSKAWALDISYRGVGLITDVRVAAGDVICVDFEPVFERSFPVEAEVLHAQQILAESRRVGSKFLAMGDD